MLAALFIGVGWCVLAYYSQVSAAKQAPAPAAGVLEDMDPLPAAASVSGVNPILQNPELPSGCEVTALTMLLNYRGFSVSKEVLASDYLPYDNDIYYVNGTRYAANPWRTFVGEPHTQRFGCYAPVVVKTANRFLAEQGSGLQAVDLTGAGIEACYEKVARGEPVLVWATIGLADPESLTQYGWIDKESGKWFHWVTGEHCYVLTGYTPATVSVCDPLEGEMVYNRALFEQRYEALYCQAVSIELGAGSSGDKLAGAPAAP